MSMTPPQETELFQLLMDAYPAELRLWPPEQIRRSKELYMRVLRDLEYPRIRDAILRLIRTHKKFPTIANIRIAADWSDT